MHLQDTFEDIGTYISCVKGSVCMCVKKVETMSCVSDIDR